MTATIPHRQETRYATNQRKRRELIEVHGIDAWRVSATPDALLDRLKPEQLTLVDDVAAEFDRIVTDRTPRDSWSCLLDETAESRDEAVSTAYFRARLKGEEFDLPGWFGIGDGAA